MSEIPSFKPQTHSFNVSVAATCSSVEAAILFEHILFWLEHNKNAGTNQIHGKTWMYEASTKMQLRFHYMSERQIQRALVLLENKGYIIRDNFNENKFDKRTWYTVADQDWIDSKIISPMRQKCRIGASNLSDQYKDKDITTDNTERLSVRERVDHGNVHNPSLAPSFSSEIPKSKPPVVPKQAPPSTSLETFGAFVQLKKGEYEDLCRTLGKFYVDHYIASINDWVPNNQPKKDYAATIRSWHRRDKSSGTLPIVELPINVVDQPSDIIVENRRLCESVRAKAARLFSAKIFFEVGPVYATLRNMYKDFEKKYLYNKIDPMTLRKELLRDMDDMFPGWQKQ